MTDVWTTSDLPEVPIADAAGHRRDLAVFELMRLGLELLHAEHVGALPREPGKEPFARGAAQTGGPTIRAHAG